MNILVINAGSSSLKYQLIDMTTETAYCIGGIERIGLDKSNLSQKVNGEKHEISCKLANHEEAFKLLLDCITDPKIGAIKSIDEINAIGHRMVPCGKYFVNPEIVTDKVLATIDEILDLAPLHVGPSLKCINICRKLLNVLNCIVFDTAFHSTMPDYAYMYAIPYSDYEEHQIRRYGFHGTSHKYVSQVAIKYLKEKGLANERIITCHLGNGSSITAVKNGKCIDTSMGMTPLAGVPMGTRCGDIDAAVVSRLCVKHNFSVEQCIDYLNKNCGFKGLSGVSDARDLLLMAAGKLNQEKLEKICEERNITKEQAQERAELIANMFAYSVRKYIGSYASALEGLDCLVFTGGIGENSIEFRERILTGTSWLGIDVDFDLNLNLPKADVVELSKPNSKVKVLVIPTNEEIMIARETLALI